MRMLYKGTMSKPLRAELKHGSGAPCQALESVPLRTQSVGCRATGPLVHSILTDDSKPSIQPPSQFLCFGLSGSHSSSGRTLERVRVLSNGDAKLCLVVGHEVVRAWRELAWLNSEVIMVTDMVISLSSGR